MTSPIDVVEMAWRKEPAEGAKLPLYLYGERRQLVASLSFQVSRGYTEEIGWEGLEGK